MTGIVPETEMREGALVFVSKDVQNNPSLPPLSGANVYNVPASNILTSGVCSSLDVSAYQGKADLSKKEVVFIRIYLMDRTYTKIECGIVSGGKSSDKLDMGIYADDGASPIPSPTGPLLGSTGLIGTDDTDDSFFTKVFVAPVVIATAGFYWLAIYANNKVKLLTTSHKFNKMFRSKLFVTIEDYGNGPLADLPGSPSFEDAQDMVIPYLGIMV